jgi:hypothetical protein
VFAVRRERAQPILRSRALREIARSATLVGNQIDLPVTRFLAHEYELAAIVIRRSHVGAAWVDQDRPSTPTGHYVNTALGTTLAFGPVVAAGKGDQIIMGPNGGMSADLLAVVAQSHFGLRTAIGQSLCVEHRILPQPMVK